LVSVHAPILHRTSKDSYSFISFWVFVSIAVADLAAREDIPLEGFGLFGVVQEVGVDVEGLHI
jgi:hypothetical protein